MKISSYLNIFIVVIVSMAFVIFNTVFFKFFPRLALVKPNLVLLLVVYIALNRNFFEGILIAFVVSYIESLHTPSLIGGVLVVNILIFFVLNFLSRNVFVRSLKMLLILITSVVVAEKIVFLLLVIFLRDTSFGFIWFIKRCLIEIPINILFYFPVFGLLRKIDLFTGVKKERTDFFSGPIYLRKA